jgi:hypothetical protein
MKLSKAKQKEIATKRQYRFEEEAKILTPWRKQLDYRVANAFARLCWTHEGYQNACPMVNYGPGLKQGTRRLSYAFFNEDPYIELARNQRDKITILHELLHYKHPEHNDDFYKAMINHLFWFHKFEFNELCTEGLKFKLKYQF